MKYRRVMFIIITAVLTACAGQNEDKTPATPDEVLLAGLQEIADSLTDDPETAGELVEIYNEQFIDLKIILSNQYTTGFKNLVSERNVSDADIRMFYEEFDSVRDDLITRSFQQEVEKADLLGPELFRSVIKSEESVLKDYYKALLEERL